MTSTRTDKRSRTLFVAALAAAVPIFLAACGGGGSGGNASPPPASSGSAVLEWNPVVATDLAGYRIHYGTATGFYPMSADAGTSATFTLNGLTSGSRYYFVVTAFDSSGQESGYSNEVFKDIP
jgi:hypothetical protein